MALGDDLRRRKQSSIAEEEHKVCQTDEMFDEGLDWKEEEEG
jgi:hypothetical protein